MKHYVIGLVFNNDREQVLLIEKLKPNWMRGRWNGIGGKIEEGELPIEAMHGESLEETGCDHDYKHCLTFVCPGGTVFVYKAISGFHNIPYKQIENEKLKCFDIENLPEKLMDNLRWMIPFCLSSIQMPIVVHQLTGGVKR